MSALLSAVDLQVEFGKRRTAAVRRASFEIQPGQRLGLIGQSGSGKSVTALALMGLLPETARVKGSVKFQDRELVGMPDSRFSRIRGASMSMVFQEPMTALDPTMRVGRQVAEVDRLRRPGGNTRTRVMELLTRVGFTDPERIANAYPHQLSGGQRQRVIVAMAVFNNPKLVICDEPTTALDVTVQKAVLDLLNHTLTRTGAACLFISHDLAVVSQVCSDALVMLDGHIVESGPIQQVFGDPQHPYTRGLVATARLDLVTPGDRLPTIEDYYRPGES